MGSQEWFTRSQAAVERPAAGTHLRRVRVVARQLPDQEADHHGLAGRERACGHHPIALASGRRGSTPSSSGTWVLLASLRKDWRSSAMRRGGAGRPGRMNLGQGIPFRLTPSKDEHSPGPSEPSAAPDARWINKPNSQEAAH